MIQRKLVSLAIVSLLVTSGLQALEYDNSRLKLLLSYENRANTPGEIKLCSEEEGLCLSYDLRLEGARLIVADPLHSWKVRVILEPTSFFGSALPPIHCYFPETGSEYAHVWDASYDIRTFKTLKQKTLVVKKVGEECHASLL